MQHCYEYSPIKIRKIKDARSPLHESMEIQRNEVKNFIEEEKKKISVQQQIIQDDIELQQKKISQRIQNRRQSQNADKLNEQIFRIVQHYNQKISKVKDDVNLENSINIIRELENEKWKHISDIQKG
ncbi:hypothetical protein pb186bvf_000195 [Paramecium bursaria]